MSRFRFALVAAAALALPLLAAEKGSAQMRQGWGGRGHVGYYNGWGGSYGWGGYTPWYGSNYTPWYGNAYTYSYPYTYSSPYAYSYYPYSYGSTYYSPTVYSSPTMYSNAYVSGTSPAGASSTTQSFYPPDAQGNMPALIEVQVPADAQVWFDDENTSQRGMERTFRSPALQPGQDYSYEVKARWTENGKDVERTRKVHIHAGERVSVNFMANEEGVGAPNRTGSEGTTPRPASGSEGTGTTPRPGSGS
jgi:uncharacterized protein (TIGR03000 family)